MIHIYSGNGKGKTTAGFGLVLRMAGYGKQIGVAKFLKDGTSGELRALRALHGVSIHATDMPKGFYFQMNEADQKKTGQAVLELFAWVQKHASAWDCIFLDEILDALHLGLLKEEALIFFLQENLEREIILTGRNPSQKLMELCDYHTEMQERKHPYQKGIPARKGVEY